MVKAEKSNRPGYVFSYFFRRGNYRFALLTLWDLWTREVVRAHRLSRGLLSHDIFLDNPGRHTDDEHVIGHVRSDDRAGPNN